MLQNFIYSRALLFEIKALLTQKQCINNYENEYNTAHVLLKSLNFLIMSFTVVMDYHFFSSKVHIF